MDVHGYLVQQVTPAPKHAACPSPRPAGHHRSARRQARVPRRPGVNLADHRAGSTVSQNWSGRRQIPVIKSSAQASWFDVGQAEGVSRGEARCPLAGGLEQSAWR